ncbi:ROK family protein [Microbacterium sp. 179-B 1A2 NHS]|uniref:ROK family protein n=1 Tax=Microbacterium sp. 179-B 1A2 NHS TaxID=3142383 RepID=UPI0039A1F54F
MRVGLDVGGSKILAVAAAPDGRIIATDRRPTGWGPDAVVAGVVAAVRAVAGDTGPSSIGIGVPGQVVPGSGIVRHALNLGVDRLDLAAAIEDRTGIRPFVDNDVRAAAVGVAARMPALEAVAYLNLGTGVAAGIAQAGAPWRGARGAAGEIGHVAVDPAGPMCSCGQRGCIEALAGGASVARRWGRPGAYPVQEVFDAADRGDPAATALRDDVWRGVAAAVQMLVLTTDVDAVVLGGGVARLGDRLTGPVRARLRDAGEGSAFLASLALADRIVVLAQPDPVGAVGAALLGAAEVPTGLVG